MFILGVSVLVCVVFASGYYVGFKVGYLKGIDKGAKEVGEHAKKELNMLHELIKNMK